MTIFEDIKRDDATHYIGLITPDIEQLINIVGSGLTATELLLKAITWARKRRSDIPELRVRGLEIGEAVIKESSLTCSLFSFTASMKCASDCSMSAKSITCRGHSRRDEGIGFMALASQARALSYRSQEFLHSSAGISVTMANATV